MKKFISKLFYIFPSNPTILIPWLLAFIFSSILEVIGIGIIGPFIGLASNPNLIQGNFWLSQIYKFLGFTNIKYFIACIGLLVIVIFCAKSLISWFIQSHIFKFSYIQKEKLIARLMHGYMEAPYTVFLSKNSSEIIQNVIIQSSSFADSILNPLLNTASNIVSILAISVLLCLVSPLAVLSLLFISIPLFLFLNFFKEKVKGWGKELYESNLGVIRGVNHSLGGFKETRVIGCGNFFTEETLRHAHQFAEASVRVFAFKLCPRFMAEILLVVFVIGFTSVFLLLNQDIQKLTPILSIFAVASIRLIPSFTGIANGVNVLRASSHNLNQLYAELKELEGSRTDLVPRGHVSASGQSDSYQHEVRKPIAFKQGIVLDSVSYRYPNALSNAIDSVCLNISKGQSVALIGRSGAGKTTLVDVILGLLVPQEGDIQVDGVSIYDDLRSWQDLIGYIPQSIFLIDDTIERNVAFGVPDHLIDVDRLNKAIHAAQLEEVVANLPNGIKTRVGERGVMLSGGQRQRVGIARALYHEREILVLDEATSALDNETESMVTESIKSLSGIKTMIIIAHRLTTIEHCSQVYVMEKGKIVRSGSYLETALKESR